MTTNEFRLWCQHLITRIPNESPFWELPVIDAETLLEQGGPKPSVATVLELIDRLGDDGYDPGASRLAAAADPMGSACDLYDTPDMCHLVVDLEFQIPHCGIAIDPLTAEVWIITVPLHQVSLACSLINQWRHVYLSTETTNSITDIRITAAPKS